MSVRVTDYWTVVALGDTRLIHGWDLGVNPIGKTCMVYGCCRIASLMRHGMRLQ